MQVSTKGTVRFPDGARESVYRNPSEIVTACCVEEVLPALRRIEEAVNAGHHAAGFLSYEASSAFEPALEVHGPGALPLLWFGLYAEAEIEDVRSEPAGGFRVGDWNPLVSEGEYEQAIRQIHERIAAGDTYQVNYTFPMRAPFEGDALSWFRQLCASQGRGPFAYVDTGRFKVLSASPELFFSLDGSKLMTRPMKGTSRRGLWPERDLELAGQLRQSSKEQAENVMIVDLLRNDMGRISETNSVVVDRLFDVEQYETVWQMTSTITSRTEASICELLTALFPSGSVTGAPKIETMKIIRALEPHPRGVYCGAVGRIGPKRQAEFNVAIRTVCVDTAQDMAEYHVGGGITWYSKVPAEYRECREKAQILAHQPEIFELLESLFCDGSYFLLEEHLDRIEASARYFSIPFDRARVRQALLAHGEQAGPGPRKVRLLVAQDGSWQLEGGAAAEARETRVALAAEPVQRGNRFLYHKTTNRVVYERARALREDCDDVILWNEDGELTESTVANLVLTLAGRKVTPPIRSGLLGGTFRRHLIETGAVEEAVLRVEDLHRAEHIELINSVRKWIPAILEVDECAQGCRLAGGEVAPFSAAEPVDADAGEGDAFE